MEDKSFNREKGSLYERRAALYLQEQGCTILETNYRFHRNEIDIIAMDSEAICFIEVKYRNKSIYGRGDQAVDMKKQQAIRRTAEAYLIRQGYDLYKVCCRFDIISFDDGVLHHYQNAF